jgi:hypothetical protein
MTRIDTPITDTREIATWAIEVRNEASPDRIAAAQKDDRYRCRHSLGGLTAASAGGNHCHSALD